MTPDRRSATAAAAASAILLAGCADGDSTAGGGDPAPDAATEVSTMGSVDIGGRSLSYACEGDPVEGEPTILLESGANLGVGGWYPLLTDLADRGHQVCAFDRAGFGGSDPAPEARRTSADTVDDLLAALDTLDLVPPYVLVAHSAGALEAALLTDREPDLVAGVVLVDPLGPHVDDAARAALPPERPGEPPGIAEERDFLTVVSRDPGQNPEHLAIAASEHEAAAVLDRSGPLWGDLPLVVLQAPLPPLGDLPASYVASLRAAVDADMRQYAAESRDGRLLHLHHTGHLVMTDQPRAIVRAIDDVLAR